MSASSTPMAPGQTAGRLTLWIYGLAGVLIALAAASLVFVGLTASREADRQALENEKRLFENALRERQVGIAQEQLALAQWDRAVEGIYLDFDTDFVEDEIVDSLWHDFELERTFLIGPQHTVLAEAFRDSTDFSNRRLDPADPIARLAEQSHQLFARNRIRIAGGYGQRPTTPPRAADVAAFAFAELDGRPALMSAMAVVPDDGTVALGDAPPVILVSARYLDATFLADLNAQLSFADLNFDRKVPARPHPTDWLLKDAAGLPFGVFTWDGQKPGRDIWRMIVPMIAVLAAVLAAAAILLGRKIGKLSGALEESERRNRYLALHDALSGLANRLQFTDLLAHAIDQLPARPFALIACDLDRFKAVNDTYGHAAGDTVIRAVAGRLSNAVGDDGTVGRIGGDEFVILMTATADRERLAALADDILVTIAQPIGLGDGVTTDVGISVGIAVAPDCGMEEARIIAAADEALYAAKEAGRNCALFYKAPGTAQLLPDNRPKASADVA